MHREAGGVDPQLDEMPDTDVFLQNRVRDLETLAVFGVHGDTIDQLVAVGELLLLELSFQVFAHEVEVRRDAAKAFFSGQSLLPDSPCRYRASSSLDRWASIRRTSRRIPFFLGISIES